MISSFSRKKRGGIKKNFAIKNISFFYSKTNLGANHCVYTKERENGIKPVCQSETLNM